MLVAMKAEAEETTNERRQIFEATRDELKVSNILSLFPKDYIVNTCSLLNSFFKHIWLLFNVNPLLLFGNHKVLRSLLLTQVSKFQFARSQLVFGLVFSLDHYNNFRNWIPTSATT